MTPGDYSFTSTIDGDIDGLRKQMERVNRATKPATCVTRTDLVKGLAAVAVGALVVVPASVWLGVSTVDGALRIGYGYTLGAFFLAATLWRKARP